MDINTINRITWWIPLKQLREDVKRYLIKSSKIYEIYDYGIVKSIEDNIENNRNDLLYKYRKLINNLDNEDIDIINEMVSNFLFKVSNCF